MADTDLIVGELQAILEQFGGLDTNHFTEVIMFSFASATLQSYRLQKKGFIAGIWCNNSASFGVSIGVDLPSAVDSLGSTKVTTGLVWPPMNSAPSLQAMFATFIRAPFNANDLLNVRNYTAGTAYVGIVLAYPVDAAR